MYYYGQSAFDSYMTVSSNDFGRVRYNNKMISGCFMLDLYKNDPSGNQFGSGVE